MKRGHRFLKVMLVPMNMLLVMQWCFIGYGAFPLGKRKRKIKLSCGNYFLEKKEKVCYTADDTMVVLVMALMETDGKGNSHVCYPVITLNRHENSIYKQNPII